MSQMQQSPQPTIMDRLLTADNYAIVVTNTNVDHLLWATPIFKHIFNTTGLKANIFATKPYNSNCFAFIEGSEYVESIEIIEKIDQAYVDELSKRFGLVTMANFGVAMQQGIPRGYPPSVAMGALIQIALPVDVIFDFSLTPGIDQYPDAINKLSEWGLTGKKYTVVAPPVADNEPPQKSQFACWANEKWLEFFKNWNYEKNGSLIIVGEPNSTVILPDGIEDYIHSVYTSDLLMIAGLIANAELVISIDNWESIVARAFSRPIVQIHSGMPIGWSGAVYVPGPNEGLSRLIASIDIKSIEVGDVVKSTNELFAKIRS